MEFEVRALMAFIRGLIPGLLERDLDDADIEKVKTMADTMIAMLTGEPMYLALLVATELLARTLSAYSMLKLAATIGGNQADTTTLN